MRRVVFAACLVVLVACERSNAPIPASQSRICEDTTSRQCDERRVIAIAIREHVGAYVPGERIYLAINHRDPEPWAVKEFRGFEPASAFSAGEGRRKFDVSIDRWVDHEFIEIVVVMTCGFTCGTAQSFIYRRAGRLWRFWQGGGTNWIA